MPWVYGINMNLSHTLVAQPQSQRENTMSKPETNQSPVNDVEALQDVSKALLGMRDALTKLSLALKDWQYEHDLTKREEVQGITQALLTSLATAPKSRPDQAPL